jgi:hypothetical protein
MAGDSSVQKTLYDESRWPVVVVKTPPQIMDDRAFEEQCKQSFSYFDRGQSFGLVFDVRESPTLSAERRRFIAELTDRRMAQHPDVRLVTAVVVSNAIQRGVVKAIAWLTRQPVPIEVVTTVGEGIAWCQKTLAAGPSRKRA